MLILQREPFHCYLLETTTTMTSPSSPLPVFFFLSFLSLSLQENWHPLYNGSLSSNPLKAITEVPPEGLLQASIEFFKCRFF